jgi:hypothetical protein
MAASSWSCLVTFTVLGALAAMEVIMTLAAVFEGLTRVVSVGVAVGRSNVYMEAFSPYSNEPELGSTMRGMVICLWRVEGF